MGGTKGVGTVYPSGSHGFTPCLFGYSDVQYILYLLCCVSVLFVFVLCFLCFPFLQCPFLIAPSVFSHVYSVGFTFAACLSFLCLALRTIVCVFVFFCCRCVVCPSSFYDFGSSLWYKQYLLHSSKAIFRNQREVKSESCVRNRIIDNR